MEHNGTITPGFSDLREGASSVVNTLRTSDWFLISVLSPACLGLPMFARNLSWILVQHDVASCWSVATKPPNSSEVFTDSFNLQVIVVSMLSFRRYIVQSFCVLSNGCTVH